MNKQPKRTMTMSFHGLDPEDDDDDDDADFFDSTNRFSSVVPIEFGALPASDDDDDDEFEDPRMSFSVLESDATTSSRPSVSMPPRPSVSLSGGPPPPMPMAAVQVEDFDMWMAAPAPINERRKRLFQDMGLNSKRNLLSQKNMMSSKNLTRVRTMGMSKKMNNIPKGDSKQDKSASSMSNTTPPLPPKKKEVVKDSDHDGELEQQSLVAVEDDDGYDDIPDIILVRSRSDGDMHSFSAETKKRKEEMIGKVSKQKLTRTLSALAPFIRLCNAAFHVTSSNNAQQNNKTSNNNTNGNAKGRNGVSGRKKKARKRNASQSSTNQQQLQNGQVGAFFLIKNLDTGKEFVVKEFAEDGMWNRLSDLQTGKQLTMEEFEKSVGYSPVVKELMRRQGIHAQISSGGGGSGGGPALERKTSVNALLSKSFRASKKRTASLIKNLNKVASSVTGANADKETPNQEPTPTPAPSSQKGGKSGGDNTNKETTPIPEWVRTKTQGKTHRELSALRFCQEIPAHQGSIWTIKFNTDGRYLASAGEDKVINIWEVQECEIASLLTPDEAAANATPLHPATCQSPGRPPLSPDLFGLEKKKGKSASSRANSMPDYVRLPDTAFSLSNEPVVCFEGHLEDVLDISWSRSKLHLLTSSMDKTVRLWDLETKTCLKLFAHNDYVTCIQFNPVNDEYFISGSLDAKVRMWSVPGRRVVDWTDLHEMVTATCYTPDGQGAAVGSHKGNCRMYDIKDGKLTQKSEFEINKKKSALKKITGFEFNANYPDEVLVTSADSRVRIYEGSEVTQKFRGFKNTSSQIAASYSPDGKYVISASEDSNVYIWKREERKTKTVIDVSSFEQFQCKDVSVAIPWPGNSNSNSPKAQLNSKRYSPKKDEANKNNRKLPPLPNNKKTSNAIENNNEKNVEEENNPGSEPVDNSSSVASASLSWSPRSQGNNENLQASGWGMVIVTAGLGGEIRAYQNFGIPVKAARQTNIFQM